MNYISNVFGYFYSYFKPIESIEPIEPIELIEPIEVIEQIEPIEPIEPMVKEDIIIEEKEEIYYIFINTANIYNASKLMLNNLYNNYNNKYIKIYLLKSHKLEPLFYNSVKVNELNIELIKRKLLSKRMHLHTFIDAIHSFIEYNNVKNYQIYY